MTKKQTAPPLFIKKIHQKDNQTFTIHWNDDDVQDFRLCDLQRNCPCAHCCEEFTERRLADPDKVPQDLKAISIRSMGRYGLRVQFASGCSTGIFSFERLQKMKRG